MSSLNKLIRTQKSSLILLLKILLVKKIGDTASTTMILRAMTMGMTLSESTTQCDKNE